MFNELAYDLGHTVLCYLSPTQMFNKTTTEHELKLSSSFRCDQIDERKILFLVFVLLLRSDLPECVLAVAKMLFEIVSNKWTCK